MNSVVKKRKDNTSLTADEITYLRIRCWLWSFIPFFFYFLVCKRLSGPLTSMTKSESEEITCASSFASEHTLELSFFFFFLLLQLWWHRPGDPKLWNAATWAAVPEGTTAGLQLCKFTLHFKTLHQLRLWGGAPGAHETVSRLPHMFPGGAAGGMRQVTLAPTVLVLFKWADQSGDFLQSGISNSAVVLKLVYVTSHACISWARRYFDWLILSNNLERLSIFGTNVKPDYHLISSCCLSFLHALPGSFCPPWLLLCSLPPQVDSGLCDEVVFLKVPGVSGDRLVFACTGPVNRDYDDVRRFSDAAANGIKRSVGSTEAFCIASAFLPASPASLSTGPWRQVCGAPCWSALRTRTIPRAPWWLLSELFTLSTWWGRHWSGLGLELKASAQHFDPPLLDTWTKSGRDLQGSFTYNWNCIHPLHSLMLMEMLPHQEQNIDACLVVL